MRQPTPLCSDWFAHFSKNEVRTDVAGGAVPPESETAP